MNNHIQGFQLNNAVIKSSSIDSVGINPTKTVNFGFSPAQLNNVQVQSVSFNAKEIRVKLPTNVEGYYGGNQTKPMDIYRKRMWSRITFGIVKLTDFEKRHMDLYYKICNKYGVTRDRDVNLQLVNMEEHGCGFITMVNIIADYYKNNPTLFEQTYGFPLYDVTENGERVINYDLLLVDIYLRNNTGGLHNLSVDTDAYEDVLARSFVNQNVSVDLCPKDMSIETYRAAMESGNYQYASIAVSKYKLEPYGINPEKAYKSNGGHLMTITGISENGNFIVSSWGFEWELVEGQPYISNQDGGLFLIHVDNTLTTSIGGN